MSYDSAYSVEKVKTVNFSDHLIGSTGFQRLYDHGMLLIQTTSKYLDNEGKIESRQLSNEAALCYATESMKLTTRLIQASSWLLLQRAVADDELTIDQAKKAKRRVDLNELITKPVDPDLYKMLPETFKDLVEQSFRLQSCIVHLDKQLSSNTFEHQEAHNEIASLNPVGAQLSDLQAAFCD